MQVNPQEVSGEKATTAAADLRLVSVDQLQKIHRELDACQKVIWLAGCGSRGYGFDPSYVTGAQEQLKEIEALIASADPVAQAGQVPKWIASADRLPAEEESQFLILLDDGSICVSDYLCDLDAGWFFQMGEATHWLPLPYAPAKEGE